jgi:hypothetical protein
MSPRKHPLQTEDLHPSSTHLWPLWHLLLKHCGCGPLPNILVACSSWGLRVRDLASIVRAQGSLAIGDLGVAIAQPWASP